MFSPKCCFWGWEQSWEPCSTVPRSISFLGCHFSKFIFWSFTLFLLWLLLLKLLIFKLWFIFVYFVRYLAAMVRDWVRVCRSALFYQLSQEILDGVFFLTPLSCWRAWGWRTLLEKQGNIIVGQSLCTRPGRDGISWEKMIWHIQTWNWPGTPN